MLEMTFHTIWMARKEYEIEKECTDGLLLGKIIEHSWDGIIGGITLRYDTGRILPGIDSGPCR